MLQAMLRGKLTRVEEGMEDLLTSNTFGLLHYMRADDVLLAFLGEAYDRLASRRLRHVFGDGAVIEQIRFWPSVQQLGCEFCEPDVEVIFRVRERRLALFVEAKYRSPKSSVARPDLQAPFDQLARECDNLRVMAAKEGIGIFGVVYLTRDFACPIEEIRASAKEYSEKRDEPISLYWLSWNVLPEILERFQQRRGDALFDLREMLVRLGLTGFRRLRFNELRSIYWSFAQASRTPPRRGMWTWRLPQVHWASNFIKHAPARKKEMRVGAHNFDFTPPLTPTFSFKGDTAWQPGKS